MTMNGDLVPEHEEGGSEWETIPTGAPEEFGLPPGSTLRQKQVWQRQEAFLTAYRKCGKIGQAAEASGLSRWAVIHWELHDIFGFNRRIEDAHEDYCEYLEQGMDARLADPQGNRGSDILYMFKLKAERPQKYREDVKVVGMEPVRDMLDRLTQMAADRLERERQERERQQLEGGATEGEYREVGGGQEEGNHG